MVHCGFWFLSFSFSATSLLLTVFLAHDSCLLMVFFLGTVFLRFIWLFFWSLFLFYSEFISCLCLGVLLSLVFFLVALFPTFLCQQFLLLFLAYFCGFTSSFLAFLCHRFLLIFLWLYFSNIWLVFLQCWFCFFVMILVVLCFLCSPFFATYLFSIYFIVSPRLLFLDLFWICFPTLASYFWLGTIALP